LSAVARQAGVSLATASKVLNNREGVGADTRQRVEAILAEVGYVAQGAARFSGVVPLTGSSLTILVDSVADPYTSVVLGGVLDEADALGISVLIRQLHQRGRQTATEWT
jgi:DNA-binding LacI/PurR family transcriptional regulator